MRVVALPIVCQAKRSRALGGAVLLLLAAACARTGLYPGQLSEEDELVSGGGSSNQGSGGATMTTSSGGAKALPLAGSPPRAQAGESSEPDAPNEPNEPNENPPGCEPSTERCNGRDDDCDGAVDNLPAEACEGGGFRFCVTGRMSECPRRCEVCVPGSVRICQNPYCTFWGEQECAADGQGFGNCREANPPPECAGIAKKYQNSPQLEQCCIDNGYCCLDEQDLDDDGDTREMLGACGDIACQ